jgi:hypothetical protein
MLSTNATFVPSSERTGEVCASPLPRRRRTENLAHCRCRFRYWKRQLDSERRNYRPPTVGSWISLVDFAPSPAPKLPDQRRSHRLRQAEEDNEGIAAEASGKRRIWTFDMPTSAWSQLLAYPRRNNAVASIEWNGKCFERWACSDSIVLLHQVGVCLIRRTIGFR